MERVAGRAAPRVCLASSFDAHFGERQLLAQAHTGVTPDPRAAGVRAGMVW